ncbi:hypothetical protein [Bradyrhizobium sp. BR 10261]|uniref:hypothetical protein n=1 Tax=Bradyrhizobium sp. BR 10261 TaxID=2749992 RepID=UPI001C652747|nr:hypothetical protein [Bradyrhizobium sp. BR 10261]MBW7967572.1 hypothetical protein [Bradyrhizobium sp. BR 10261]
MTQRTIAQSDICSTFFDHVVYIANRWYDTAQFGTISGAPGAPGANNIRLVPFFVRSTITLNSLGLRVQTASAGGNVQAAIYANNSTTNLPTGNALCSTASMSTTSTGSVNSAVSVQLTPGLYWFATNCDNGTAAFAATNVGNCYIGWLFGSTTQGTALASTQSFSGYTVGQTFGTWPDLTSASPTEVANSNVPIGQFKVASVP